MRLFISDSFFEKLIELSKSVQQRVADFNRKFRENSQSSAIHLEPIISLRDSSLRSARIDQAYRAILGVLGGDNYMLLYVDKHDDAYRWAKNKKFVWNEHTSSCQIVPLAVEDEEERPDDDERTSAVEDSILSGIDDASLLKIGVPDELIPLVRGIRDLNDLEAAEDRLPQDAFESLFAVMEGQDIAGIIEEIEAGKAKSGGDGLLSDNNKRRFVEITGDEMLVRIMSEGMEKWQLFLHPSQSKLVNSHYKGSVKVSGSAGTGKTIAAIHRLKHLCSRPGAKVLFTTYTKALSANLDALIRKLDVPRERYDLSNIDKVVRDVAGRFGVIGPDVWVLDYSGDDRSLALWREVIDREVSEFDEDFLYSEYIDVIVYNNNASLKDYLKQSRVGRTKPVTRKQRVEIWRLKEKYEELKRQRKAVDRAELFNMTADYLIKNNIHPYTNVIADEFQDFSNPELRFVRALAAEGADDLFLTGDPYQRIYSGRKINFTSAGINVRGKRSVKLKVNYRTTEEIKKMAVAVIKGQRYDDLDGGEEDNKGYVSLVHGEKPVYTVFDTPQEEAAHVIARLNDCLDSGIQAKDICIAARTRQLYKETQDRLHREGVRYGEIRDGSRVGDAAGLTLCTFHSLKGLEYKVAFLVGVTEKSMPSRPTADYPFASLDAAEKRSYLTAIRSLLYVAITRARQLVLISGAGAPTGLLEAT